MKILNQHFCADVNLDVGVDDDVDMETDNNNNTNEKINESSLLLPNSNGLEEAPTIGINKGWRLSPPEIHANHL